MIKQKYPTSKNITTGEALVFGCYVKLLVGPFPAAIIYTKKGDPAKRQNPPHNAGSGVWAKLDRGTGLVNLYPFRMAGEGWEIIKDVQEGIHYEFV